MAATVIIAGDNSRDAADIPNLEFWTANFAGTAIGTADALLLAFRCGADVPSGTSFIDVDTSASISTIGSVNHSSGTLGLKLGLLYNAIASAERHMRVDTGTDLVGNRAVISTQIAGLRASSTPYVAHNTAQATSSASIAPAAVNPGGSGFIVGVVTSDDPDETYTASGFTAVTVNPGTGATKDRGGYMAVFVKAVTGSGNVTFTAVGSKSTSKKVAAAIAFRDTASGSQIIATGGGQVVGV